MNYFQTQLQLRQKKELLCIVALFLGALFGISNAAAQTNEALFEEGNELYRNNQFEEAIVLYEQIETRGFVSTELYYNLGNSFYKTNQIAPSIYNYEKALQLDSQNQDAASNLLFAKRMAIDTIEALPLTFFQKMNAQYIQQLSHDQWAVLAVVFSLLTSIFFLLFYFSYRPSHKRMHFLITLSAVFFLSLSLLFSVREKQRNSNEIAAIIFSQKTEVKNAPSDTSAVVFELHEGAKVLVLDHIDTWKKIKLTDGKIGWVSQETLKEL
jgi:tetratricopeptide (TPR) repeat protein